MKIVGHVLNVIRTWLQRFFGGQTLVFAFFLCLSFVFWMMQRWDEEVEGEVDVPLALTNIPVDIEVLNDLPKTVKARVKGQGTALIRYWWMRPDTIQLSFREFYDGSKSGQLRLHSGDIRKYIVATLPSDFRLQNFSPDTLSIYYNHGESLQVPIKFVGTIATAPNFILGKIKLQPEVVDVYSTRQVLDTIEAVYTHPFDTTNLQRSVVVDIPIKPIQGVKMSSTHVSASIEVNALINDQRQATVVAGNFPAGRTLRVFPSHVTVNYVVSSADRDNIQASDFVFFVTYEDILELQSKGIARLPLRLKRQPEGVTNVRFTPQEVDYLIETREGE